MNNNGKETPSPKLTLDRQITIGFIIMLLLIVLVSAFCIFTISKLKKTQSKINGESVSLFEIIEKSAEDTVFDNEMLLNAIEVADREIGLAYLNVVIVALISIFFGGLLTIIFPKKVTKPVFNLIEATKEAKEGEYSYRVPDIKGTNEISILITSFNEMLGEIEEKNELRDRLADETRKFNDKLQQKISEVEKELRESNRELSKNERLAEIGVIVFKIAHEIKNPLSGISIALQNLESELNDEESKTTIKETIAEIQRLDGIVKELFHIALPNELDLMETNPAEILDKALNLVQYKKEAYKENVLIERWYSTKNDDLKVNLDRDQILQVLINLIFNAIDAIDSEDGKIIIDVKDDSDDFKILISDNGKGIQDKDSIFQPFYTTKKDGSGLGLPISKSIIEKHGGELIVEDSQLGSGTTFIIKIPKH